MKYSTEFDMKFTSRSSQKRDVALNASQIRHYHLGNTLGHVAMFGHSFVYYASYSHSLVLISLFQFGCECVRACASSIFVHIKGARKFSQSKFIIISIGGTSHHTATNPFCCQLRTIIHCTHGVVVGQESRHKRNTEGFQSVADILTIAWEIIYVPMEKSKPLHASSKYLREIFYFS